MNVERRILVRRLNAVRTEIRSLVAELRTMEPAELSEEWAVHAMECAAQFGVVHNKLLYGKPLDDPERIDSSFPF